jgi:hypothetical protein
LTDMLNKAYSNLVFVRDAKDAADLFLEFGEGTEDSIGISFSVKELHKHWFHPVLGSSSEVGSCKQGFLVRLNRGELKVDVHLSEPIVKRLTVSIVEIGLGDLVVTKFRFHANFLVD